MRGWKVIDICRLEHPHGINPGWRNFGLDYSAQKNLRLKIGQVLVGGQRVIMRHRLRTNRRNGEYNYGYRQTELALEIDILISRLWGSGVFVEQDESGNKIEQRYEQEYRWFVAREENIKNVEPEARIRISRGNGAQPEGKGDS